jgi:hypothetical protein
MYGFNDICWQTSASSRNSIGISTPVTIFSCQSDAVNTCRLTLIQAPNPQGLMWHGIGNQRLVKVFQRSLQHNTLGTEMLECYRVWRHTVYWENMPYHIKQYRNVFCYPTKITNLIQSSHSTDDGDFSILGLDAIHILYGFKQRHMSYERIQHV